MNLLDWLWNLIADWIFVPGWMQTGTWNDRSR